MGKKKSRKSELKPWCWYCDREFDDDKILINHQKAKHFKCDFCNKKLSTAGGLIIHLENVHRESIRAIPNSINGRESVDVEIFGMEGVPLDDLQKHIEKKEREHGGNAQKKQKVVADPDAIRAQFEAFQASQSAAAPPNNMPQMPFPMPMMPNGMPGMPGMPFPLLMPNGMPMPFPLPGMPFPFSMPGMPFPGMPGFPPQQQQQPSTNTIHPIAPLSPPKGETLPSFNPAPASSPKAASKSNPGSPSKGAIPSATTISNIGEIEAPRRESESSPQNDPTAAIHPIVTTGITSTSLVNPSPTVTATSASLTAAASVTKPYSNGRKDIGGGGILVYFDEEFCMEEKRALLRRYQCS